jgi:hypothetical protein
MSHDKPKGCMLLISITNPHVSQAFLFFIFYFIYDRNSNLNSYTLIFWDPGGRTYTLIDRWDFLGRGIITGPNAKVAKFILFFL